MRRLLTTALLTTVLLMLVTTPALAHASFDVTQLPVGETVEFSLRVPLEREAGNSAIAVLVTAGWGVGDCPAAEGWSCDTRAEEDGDSVISLTRVDDAAADVERFAVTLTAPDEAGVYAFPVVQSYDDGSEVAWIEEPGTDHPAPRIQVGDSDATIERDDELPTHDAGVEDAPSPQVIGGDRTPPATEASAAPTEAPAADPTAEPTDDATMSSPASDEAADAGGSLWLIVLSLLAVIAVSVGAAVISRRPGRSS